MGMAEKKIIAAKRRYKIQPEVMKMAYALRDRGNVAANVRGLLSKS
jgi:hypothetical protein